MADLLSGSLLENSDLLVLHSTRPLNMIPLVVIKLVSRNLPDVKDVLNFSIINRQVYNLVMKDEVLWINFLKRIRIWKNGKVETSEIVDDLLLSMKISVGNPSLAFQQFKVCYTMYKPIVQDLLVTHYDNIQNSSILQKITSPKDQALLLNGLRKFVVYFKNVNFQLYQKLQIRLNSIVEMFTSSLLREIDHHFSNETFEECHALIDSLHLLGEPAFDLTTRTGDHVDNMELILEFFINKFADDYSILYEVKETDIFLNVIGTSLQNERGVVKGYQLQFVKLDEVFEKLIVIFDREFTILEHIFRPDVDGEISEVPIVLKLVETFLNNYLIGRFVDELITRAKEIDESEIIEFNQLVQARSISDSVLNEDSQNPWAQNNCVRSNSTQISGGHSCGDGNGLISENQYFNVMNESSLYFQLVPYLYNKISLTFSKVRYPADSKIIDYPKLISELINFYYGQYSSEFIDLLPRQCHFSLIQLINRWQEELKKQEQSQENEIMQFVDEEQDTKGKKGFLLTSGKDILTGFTSIFKGSVQKEEAQRVSETLEYSNRSQDQNAQQKRLTRFAAKLEILSHNLDNIKSLVSVDLTILILQHVKNTFLLLLSLGDSSHLNKETEKKIATTCQEVFTDSVVTLTNGHVKIGFDEAIHRLKVYNPIDQGAQIAVEPLKMFVELVNNADLVNEMLKIFYQEELIDKHLVISKEKSKKDFLMVNNCEKSMSKLETLLDTYVADGLNTGIEVLMNEISYITMVELDEGIYSIRNEQDLLRKHLDPGVPTSFAQKTIQVLRVHVNMLIGSIDKSIIDVFRQEIGERFVNDLVKLINKKLTISTIGAMFLINDLNFMYNFFLELKLKPIVNYFIALRQIAQLYLIDSENSNEIGKLVVRIGKDNGMFTQEEVYEFVTRRADWERIKKHVDKIIYGLQLQDCIIM
ncbi:Plasma membrane protein recycling [Komagataella phaffii CBS 7435]|uniref:F-box protein involved in recycling plasma membrane proteins internalized by endocytosis n=2 Tax=Komagataella phaffii TaxID=460519 RepID=C4R956_KOMPG|nr:F-box protein involved in recycling plasma membrane proteins internalized by endocytosis [Komagataella phaffii GS115]AOA64558.1 GQ67_05256T0 [Komagataella phaffii]CAH2450458.1 Plasma membrane protein recycling [Komagataella phaffii CBS 7435]AOA70256.1 GQ68_05238T0 [Komagataella phaffii GS115]CAY72131.1 F-box protein involved in recycling plasma membrane proteins internalized by endocytosis [Komagataella phaffii GS115]CCA40265.1 Plasma membrane protein recycling [Komagataella phaffii CBS 743